MTNCFELSLRKYKNELECSLTKTPSLSMSVPTRRFSVKPKTFTSIMNSYKTVTNLIGKENKKDEFIESLFTMSSTIGFGLEDIFEHYSFMGKNRVNLTLKLDQWTRKIPWELAIFHDKPDQVLCERFNVGRAMDVEDNSEWETLSNLNNKYKVKALIAGLDYKKDLPQNRLYHAEEDAKIVHSYLLKFSKSKKGKNLEVLPKQIGLNVKKSLLEKRFKERITIFHFSGHGILKGKTGSIVVANNETIKTTEIRKWLKENNTRAPTFSFFNACETCLQKNIESDIHDWAYAMANHGGRALIGTFWTVIDSDATDFSLEFYKNFLKYGKSLGESVRQARLYVKNSNDEDSIYTWPAFVLYGQPYLKAKDILV